MGRYGGAGQRGSSLLRPPGASRCGWQRSALRPQVQLDSSSTQSGASRVIELRGEGANPHVHLDY